MSDAALDAMGATRTTRASRRRDAAGVPPGDGVYETHIVERVRALRRPNPARGDAGTGVMHKRLRDDDADVSPSTRDGDAAAPREAKRTSVPLLAIAARADAVPTDVERDIRADLVIPRMGAAEARPPSPTRTSMFRISARDEACMIGDDDPDDMDAPVGVPEVEEEVRRDDVLELDDAALPVAPDAARVERTVRMTLCVVGTQYQEHGRENSWRVVDRSMVLSRDADNERDARAISVGYFDATHGDIKTVGFIPRKWARKIAPRMDTTEARVVSATLDARWRVQVTFECDTEAAFHALTRVREAVTRTSIRGRGAARRAAIAESNHGLKRTDAFWERDRLGATLYNHVPIPAIRASVEVHNLFSVLTDEYVTNSHGNGRFEVKEIAEDGRARAQVNDETRREMFESLARVGDGRASEEMNSKLIAFTTRKRPLYGELRVYKCRAYPTTDQAAILRRFAKVQTFDAYNAAVVRISEDATLAKTKNLTALRQSVGEEVTEDVPVYMRDAGVLAAVNAHRSNVRKQKKARSEGRTVHAFTLHPRRTSTTKVMRCTFEQDRRTIKSIARPNNRSRSVLLDFAYRAVTKNVRALGTVRVREGAFGDLDGKVNFVRNTTDAKCQKENITFEFDKRNRRWYAAFLYDAPLTQEKPLSECRDVAALDLGIRTPATVVGLTNGDVCTPYATNFRDEIHKRWRRMEDLQRRISLRSYGRARRKYVGTDVIFRRNSKQYKASTRRMKQLLARLHLKFTRWIEHEHKTVSKFLVNRYDGIICPPLDGAMFVRQANDTRAQKKIKRRCRRLKSATSMRKLVHALKYAAIRDGKYVMTERAIESGTSMTCGFCGWRDEHLGFERTFECHVCDLSIDRDVNGARNNGLQALADGGFGRPPEYWNTHA